ncbi:c-type cytochrome [Povalibacter sp.]|uniref:c-type cytochrome n=1 Tax=Povalibacter sp. TaxID=1962978 RepID=UPI002F3F2823
MTRRASVWLMMIVASCLAIEIAAAEDFAYCILCHGTNGNGNAAIRAPRIAGLEPWYVRRQLEAFAAGIRGTHPDDVSGLEMTPVGVRLAEEKMLEDAVRFVGSLGPGKPAATIAGDVQKGKQLYAACSACHGPAGEGNQAQQAPALAARSDWYLVQQINNYKLGQRGADARDTFGAQMRAVVATLPDDQAVADVVAYINTLN